MSAIKDLVGENVINGKHEKVNVEDLKGQVIGLYFSAHWCGPCRGFTPKLVETYNSFKAKNKNFEIIFVSSDRDEEAFKEYFGEMPWLALGFSDRDRKAQLSRKFGVQGIPTLIILNDQGEILNKDGRSAVMEDPEGENFPWKQKTISEMLENTSFETKSGTSKSFKELQAEVDYLMFYFSAHWCGPCQMFTPQLVETYKKMKDAGKKFETVFVSSDRDEEAFKHYWGEMPWLAAPFSNRGFKNDLSAYFEVEGIPTLVVIDAKNLKTITTNGRGGASADPEGKDFPWKRKAFASISASTDYLNDVPCLVLLLDKADEALARTTKETLEPIAKEHDEKFVKEGKDGKDLPLIFMFGDKSDPLADRIRSFSNLGDSKHLILLNIPEGKKFVSDQPLEKMDSAFFQDLVKNFLAGSLKQIGIRE